MKTNSTSNKGLEKVKREYWEMVYKHVDPFRKKGDGPIREYVVYCDKDCHREWWAWIEQSLITAKEEGRREAFRQLEDRLKKQYRKDFGTDNIDSLALRIIHLLSHSIKEK